MINKAKLREPIFSTCQLLSIRDKTSICLNMIVKNETGVIKRLFGSVGPFIDYFVIVDTGSNDGTPELILNLATQHRVPGEVHFQKWVNFGHNRQQALEIAIAAAKSKWLLFIDADEELRYTDQHFYRKLKPGVSYKIAKHHGSIRYAVPNLVDISENQWQWQGPAHNYLTHQAGPGLSEHLDTVWIHYHSGQGAKSHGVTSRQKYLRDAALFEAELAKNSNDTRSRFYLAQSYRDAGEPVKALEHYSIRAVLGGWQEEVFYSLYQIAKIKEQLGYADHEVIDAYLAANAAQPKRAEAIHGVARFYRVRKEYEKGYEILKKALDMNPSVDDLFIEPWIYQYGLLDEFSICAYWTARYINCLEACQKILELPDIDPKLRVRIEKNADFARIKLA